MSKGAIKPSSSTPIKRSVVSAAASVLALPDKPSIAVLPFQNMSGDPEQEYFADGMVEDVITALSSFKNLHLWADRFDGALDDIFDFQDQVTLSVVGAIAPKLEQAEIERARRKRPDSLDDMTRLGAKEKETTEMGEHAD